MRSPTTATPARSRTSSQRRAARRCEESGEDGRAVLEILLAAYASAGQGGRAVALPFRPGSARKPVDLWRLR